MRRTSWASVLVFGAATLLFSGGRAAAEDVRAFDRIADADALSRVVQHPWRSVCSDSGTGFHCLAKVRTDAHGNAVKLALPKGGYVPTDLQSAYKLPTTGGAGKTVAVIEAFHYLNAEADLQTYRTKYGLPTCTSANGCFRQVASDGTTNFAQQDPGGCDNGWPGEAALDVQMVSATCPDCKILIVESPTDQTSFAAAVNTAVTLGAVAISNSYGSTENRKVLQEESTYTRVGVLITASAGDAGYGVSYPATSAGVVAVGGTSLTSSTSTRGWAESAWSDGGSGCSSEIAKPSWQTDASCAKRMDADVAAIGDPNTGVAVYCSDASGGGWFIVGGTSASSPIIAGAFTLLGVSTSPSYAWENSQKFFDVTTGKNGTCSPAYFCTAGVGYDGPTGWGSPNGALLVATGTSGSSSSGSSGSSSGTSAGADSGSGSGSSSGSSSGTSSGADSGSGSGSGSGSSSGSTSGSTSGGSSGSTSGSTSGGSSGSGSGTSAGSSSGSASTSGSGSSTSSGSSADSGSGSSSGASGRTASSASGGSSTSSGGADGSTGAGSDAGVANGAPNDVGSNPDSPAGCGCSTVDASSGNYGSLALGVGVALGLRARRRRSRV
jgi:MYXO-CTERM domain-containing protein